MSRFININFNQDTEVDLVANALSSKLRRKMLGHLMKKSYSTVELASILNIPISTATFNLKILEKSNLISVAVRAHSRGNEKIISRKIDNINISFEELGHELSVKNKVLNIPIGSYSDIKVAPSCGIADEKRIILADDLPSAFYTPERCNAQIIWFAKGYIEYRIPNYYCMDKKILSLNISLEFCSEAPNYRNDWKSAITFWINGIEACTYVSLGDYGGRRGKLNPEWWSDFSTQFGVMKSIELNEMGTYIDKTYVCGDTIDRYKINKGDYFTLRIGVKDDAKYQGGVNLFGEKFGDYAQAIIATVNYLD